MTTTFVKFGLSSNDKQKSIKAQLVQQEITTPHTQDYHYLKSQNLKTKMPEFSVVVASPEHFKYAEDICNEMAESAKARGTGIAKRTPDYIKKQMEAGKAVIALAKEGKEIKVAGFCYIERWEAKKYAANSGLLVFPAYRKHGLARKIKLEAFKLSRKRYPNAKLFGLTTSLAVMKINSELGYHPVTFEQLTQDDEFWKGCQSCVNYEILQSKDRKNCLCTAMLFDPSKQKKSKWDFVKQSAVVKRLKSIKESSFLKKFSRAFAS